MVTKQEYAALSAAIYRNVRSDENRPAVPLPWRRTPLPDTRTPGVRVKLFFTENTLPLNLAH